MNNNTTENCHTPSFAATVEWLRGSRKVSAFMRNAGLGLNGIGVKEIVTIRYKTGEVVTEERVMKTVQDIIDKSNAENSNFEIICPRLIRIYEVTNACAHKTNQHHER